MSMGQDDEKTSLVGVETSTREQRGRGVTKKKSETQSWRVWWADY